MTKGILDLKIPYEPREWQLEASKKLNRFTVLVMHRRAGKTVFDVIQSINAILNCNRKRPQAAYVAPTYAQAKKIAWAYYKEFLEPFYKGMAEPLVTFNESELRIDFFNGGKIWLLGSENPDSIRGMYLDHVVLDEYPMMPSDFWSKVIRPCLMDRKGSAIITGTPKGKNIFFESYNKGLDENKKSWSSILKTVNDTRLLPQEELDSYLEEEGEEAYEQEMMCSFEAAIKGAYFGKQIQRLKNQDRIVNREYDPAYPVVAGLDLGLDGIGIWYLQKISGQPIIIDFDYYEDKDIPYVSNKMLGKEYVYAYIILPHDGSNRNVVNKRKTPKGLFKQHGFKVKIAERLPLLQAITSGRNLLDQCQITKRCSDKMFKMGKSKIAPLDALS